MSRKLLLIGLAAICLLSMRADASDIVGRSLTVDGITYSGTVPESDLRAFAGRFEAVRDAVRSLDRKRGWRFPFPVRIHHIDNAARFGVLDYRFVDGPLTRIIVVMDGDPDARRLAYRQLAALMIDNELGPVATPAWLRAGLLEYFANADFPGGKPISPLTKPATTPSIDSILDTDHFAFNRQTNESRAGFVIRSTLLAVFLVRSEKGSLSELFALLDSGRPVRDALGRVFELNDEAIEKAASEPYRPLQLKPVSVEESSRPFPTAAANLINAEILLGIGDTARAADAIAKSTVTSDSLTIQGLIESRLGLSGRADKSFRLALTTDPMNARPYFAFASMLVGLESTELGLSSSFSIETAERVRALLRKAIELDPGSGDAYEMLAFVNAVREEEIGPTIDLMKRALEIAPGHPWYRMRMAELQIADRNFPVARQTVLGLRRSAGDDRMRVYAESTLARMNSLETQLASLGRRNQKQSDVITDKPLSDEEIARRRAKALNESLNLSLRIRREDETRVIGTIDRVECDAGGVLVSVRTGAGTVELWNRSIENLILVSFIDKLVNSEFGCGVRSRQQTAVITFRNARLQNGSRELVSIEFVPSNFSFVGPAN